MDNCRYKRRAEYSKEPVAPYGDDEASRFRIFNVKMINDDGTYVAKNENDSILLLL